MPTQRGNSWQVRVKGPDKYHRYSFKSFEQAERWEKYARDCIAQGLPVEPPSNKPSAGPTVTSFFEEYWKSIWPYASERNTFKNQRAIEKILGGDTLMSEITGPFLEHKRDEMRAKGWVPSTINNRFSHLKQLLRKCEALGLEVHTTEVPWEKLNDNARLRFLTENEEEALTGLMRHWGLDDEARLVETLIDTGCRPSELLKNSEGARPIKWSEVSKSAGGTAPDIPDPNTGDARPVILIKRTKTKTDRPVPLTPRAKNNFLVSRQYGEERPFGEIRVEYLSRMVKKAAGHLDLEDVVLYTMRHTCASRLVQRGADLKRVQDWMGHKDIKTTLRYAKLTPKDLFSIGDLL